MRASIRPTGARTRTTAGCGPRSSKSSRRWRLDCRGAPCSYPARHGAGRGSRERGSREHRTTPMPEMHIDEGFFSARDGVRLFWQVARVASPTAHVAILHGYAEHLGRHTEIAHALTAAGYTAHLLDCRGHGQSGGKRAFVEHFRDYLSDLELFLDRVK